MIKGWLFAAVVRAAALVGVGSAAHADVNEWSFVGPGGGNVLGVQHLRQSSDALATTQRGIYRTSDRGLNWTRVLEYSSYSYHPRNLVISASQPIVSADLIYRSVDAEGHEWFAVTVASALPGSEFSALVADPNGPIYWGTMDGIVIRSSSDAEQREYRLSGLEALYPNAVRQISLAESNPSSIYLNTDIGAYRSSNASASWSPLNLPNQYSLFAPSRSDANVLLAIESNTRQAHLSVDGGTSFSTTGSAPLSILEYAPPATDAAFAIAENGLTLVTPNDGVTWSTRGLLPLSGPHDLSFDPTNPDHIFAATARGVAFSPDGGATWEPRNRGINEADVKGIFSADGTLHLVAGDGQRIYRRDGAGNWTGIARGSVPIVRVDSNVAAFATRDALYVAGSNGLARSINQGETWQLINSLSGIEGLVFDPENPLVGYASGPTITLHKTIDGGVTWNALNLTVPVQQIVIDPTNSDVLYAATHASAPTSSQAVHKSLDGGQTWIASASGVTHPHAYCIELDPSNPSILYLGTVGSLWRSIDSGATWKWLHSLPHDANWFSDVVVDPVHPTTIYASDSMFGTVERSVDNGIGWETLRSPALGHIAGTAHLSLVPKSPHIVLDARKHTGLLELEIAPDLKLETDTRRLTPGQKQTVPIGIINGGPFSATDVRMRVSLPPATGGYELLNTPEDRCIITGQQLDCQIPFLRASHAVIVDVAFTPVSGGGPLTGAVSAYEPDPMPRNNELTLDEQRTTDLSVYFDATTPIQVNQSATVTLNVLNGGPSIAGLMRVEIIIPPGLTVENTQGMVSCANLGATLNCTCAILEVGQAQQALIQVKSDIDRTFQLTASVTPNAQDTDPNSSNNSATGSIVITPAPTHTPTSGGGGGGGGSSSVLMLLLSWLMLGRFKSRTHQPSAT